MGKMHLIPIKTGDTKRVGEKEYELQSDGIMKMQLAVPFVQTYTRDGLLAKKADLEAKLTEVNALLAKMAELEGAP